MEYTVDGFCYHLSAGDAIYIPTAQARTRKPANGVDYVSFNFIAQENCLPKVHLQNCVEEVVRSIVQAIDCIFSRTINLSDPRFCALLESLILQLKAELSAALENRVSKAVKQYVKNHLAEKITLEDLGKQVFLSPNYCERIFKQETGMPIVEYILEKRIEYAKNLLWDNSVSLTLVAKAVGFHDYGYFCRIFKKRTGYSPLQYRKQTQGKHLPNAY
jgi:YesN/AraC family two-component response regulator